MSLARKVQRRFEKLRRKLRHNPGHVGALLKLYERAPRLVTEEEGERLVEAAEELRERLKT